MSRYPKISDTPNSFDEQGNKLCRNCKNVVSKNRRHYCSNRCIAHFNQNNSWFFVRKDILRRDKYKCSICKTRNRKTNLDIDHIIPLQMGGKPFDKLNLRVLCKPCHKMKTKLMINVYILFRKIILQFCCE